jgi:LuxR family transcriptional regulator, quorum-sensing system regulator BjaR1
LRSTLTDALDFVGHLQNFDDMNAAWTAFLGYTAEFGFTKGALADMPGPGERVQDTVLCLSWPDAWTARYIERNYIRNDPARLHLSRSVEPFLWSEMTACDAYTPQQKKIVYEASEFRMKSGIIFPMPGLRSGPAMVTIAGENDDVSDDDLMRLHLAAIYTHAVVRKLSRLHSDQPIRPSFSPRERECLQWYAAGKSEWEIGEILSISEKTANTYLERAKQKLGVATRKQAIVAGLRNGVIQY